MSAPVDQDGDVNNLLLYAPRWARERPERPQHGAVEGATARAERQPSALPRAPRLPEAEHERPLAADHSPFEGDLAVKQLRTRQSLDPQPVPEPPEPETGGSAFAVILRFSIAAAAAAVAAFFFVGIIPFSQLQQNSTGYSTSSPLSWLFGRSAAPAAPAQAHATIQSQPAVQPQTAAPAAGMQLASATPEPVVTAPRPSAVPQPKSFPQLVVENRRGMVNESIPLGVALKGATGDASVVMKGLVEGARLNTGAPMGQGSWRISAKELANAVVLPPKNFIGAMEIGVDLRLADNTIADSRVLKLEWIGAPHRQAALPEPQLHLAPDEIASLIKRGEDFIAMGDIAAARLVLERAADAHDAHAALALGATFDPNVLRQLKVVGFSPDVAQARVWYQRAAQYGSTEATQRLGQLAQDVR